MKTEVESDLEALLPSDDQVDHGVCPICYPQGSKPQLAVCGADVTDEILLPRSECVNICPECAKQGPLHMLKHVLGKI